MIYKRDKYLNELNTRRNNHLIKIITGLRRCGKSFLLNQLFYQSLLADNIKSTQIIRFAFDLEEDIIKLDKYLPNEPTIIKEGRFEYVNNHKFMAYLNDLIKTDDIYYLLLDEVQNLYRFIPTLNSLLSHQNYDLYVTGSNSKFLSSDVATEFSGRGDIIHLLPLDFSEYYDQNQSVVEAYQNYCYYGGIPLVALCKSDKQKMSQLENLYRDIYLKDLFARHSIKQDRYLIDTLRVIASCVGSPINPTKIENTFNSVYQMKLSNDTIANYIKWFKESFLIHEATRFDVSGRKYIGSPFKLYFEDIGIKNALLDFREIDETDLMENIIYNHLRYLGFNVDVGVVEISEKTDRLDRNNNQIYTKKQLEVDFVCNSKDTRIYIQSAYSIPDSEKEKQEMRPFLNIVDSFKKIIVVKDNIKMHYNNNGYLIINIYEFLTTQKWMI